jgi:2-oxoglutarate ferredoxin oxidoreductase subunit delta
MSEETRKKKRKDKQIHIYRNLCKSCGICEGFCTTKTLRTDASGNLQVADLDACNACGLCELRCPDFAIEIEKEDPEGKETDA